MPSTRDRFWPRRLRWRLRGAWDWPAFALVTLLDALVLTLLPPVASDANVVAWFGWLLVAAFGNLLMVALVAPWIARRLERREKAPGESSPPLEVLTSRAATTLLVLGLLGLLAAGLAQRPVIVSETPSTEAVARAIQQHLDANGPAEAQRNADTANTARIDDDYFRVCIARDDRTRAFCYFVETDREPPRVTPDRDQRPNAVALPRSD